MTTSTLTLTLTLTCVFTGSAAVCVATKAGCRIVEAWLAGESRCCGELALLRCRGRGELADGVLCHCFAVQLKVDSAVHPAWKRPHVLMSGGVGGRDLSRG